MQDSTQDNTNNIFSVILSSLGSAIEFYEFIIITVFAVEIGRYFFSVTSPFLASLTTFSVFASGWLARPLGGLILGHLGDRYGRKKIFLFSISVMAFCSLIICLIPPYKQIGSISPIIFVTLRLVQGVALGGEVSGALVFVYELIARNKSIATALVISFLTVGILAANLVSYVIFLVTKETGHLNDWKYAVFIGSILGFISLLLRQKFNESPEYIANQDKIIKLPSKELFIKHKGSLLQSFIISGVEGIILSQVLVFLPTYFRMLNFAQPQIFIFSVSLNLAFIVGTMVGGYLSDKAQANHKVMQSSTLLSLLLVPLMFVCVYKHILIIPMLLIALFVVGLYAGSYSAVINSLFPVEVRFSAVAITQNLAFALIGGSCPLISLFLMHRHYWYAPALTYGLFTVTCLLIMRGLRYLNVTRN